ncbi:hypothetical protein RHSIM_Rhsim12G0072300 [Rhododendron simsii]|uniref:Cytochrome P450 n=1 Tax=Rhododendron simsii TaxID=118357 RepID=A0A834G2V9_RHOSS|nr:hypothetical protein RHSIM_Rhsim12G0072300 [Rhododendron simsii]
MIIISLSIGVCIFLLAALIGFLHKVWWTPIRIQNIMRSQGIKGPAYRFLHGNTKEIIQMREESIGNAMDISSHEVFPRIMPHIHAWKKLYGKKYLIWHGSQAQLVVTEPELIKEILNNKDGTYLKGKPDVITKKLIGDGIFITYGEKWSKLRKIANHAFYAESLKGMIPAMITSVETMLERWEQNQAKEIDVYKEFRLLTAEVISRTAFGSSYLEGENIFDMLTKLGMIAARNVFRIRIPAMEKFFKLRDDLESDKIEQAIQESIIGMIEKRAEKMMRGEENNYGKNYLIWHGPHAQLEDHAKLVVTEPEFIKEILNNKDGTYLKGKLDVITKKLTGDGIFIIDGEKWSKLRKIANHAFYVESLKGMILAMIASVETMLERWEQNKAKEEDDDEEEDDEVDNSEADREASSKKEENLVDDMEKQRTKHSDDMEKNKVEEAEKVEKSNINGSHQFGLEKEPFHKKPPFQDKTAVIMSLGNPILEQEQNAIDTDLQNTIVAGNNLGIKFGNAGVLRMKTMIENEAKALKASLENNTFAPLMRDQ